MRQIFERGDTDSSNSTSSSPTDAPPAPSLQGSSTTHLTGGVISGIAIGCVVGVLLVAIAASWLIKLRKRRQIASLTLPLGVEDQRQEMDSTPADHGPYEVSNLFQSELRGDIGGTKISGRPVYRASELEAPP